VNTADRNRVLVQIRALIYAAEDKIRDLEPQRTKAAAVLLSGWERVAQVWREKKAEVEDGRS
jgi:hypothetical protein